MSQSTVQTYVSPLDVTVADTQELKTINSSLLTKTCPPVQTPKWRPIAITVAVVLSVIVFLVTLLVNVAVRQQPGCRAAIQPPAQAFAIVWPILFLCLAVAVGFGAYDACVPPVAPIPILLLLLLILLTCMLCSWTFVDQTDRKASTYLILGTLFVALLTLTGYAAYSRTKVPALLLTPLIAWLIFALVLSSQTAETCGTLS